MDHCMKKSVRYLVHYEKDLRVMEGAHDCFCGVCWMNWVSDEGSTSGNVMWDGVVEGSESGEKGVVVVDDDREKEREMALFLSGSYEKKDTCQPLGG